MPDAMTRQLRKALRPFLVVAATAVAVVLFYCLAFRYHATTLLARNVQLVSVRQKAEAAKAPQYLAFDDEWVSSLKRILLVGTRSPGTADDPEMVLWQSTPELPQLELVTPARDDAQLDLAVGVSGETGRIDLYLTPSTDGAWTLRDTSQSKLQQWPIPAGHTLHMQAQLSGRREQLSIFSGLHASGVRAGKVQTDVYPFTLADQGKEICPGDQIELGGDDLEITTVRVVTSAPWGSVLHVGLTTDSYSSVHARKRDCLHIHRLRTLLFLGTLLSGALGFLVGLPRVKDLIVRSSPGMDGKSGSGSPGGVTP
jgi:hypothetical protein